MSEPSAALMIDPARLRWIETWAQGWRLFLDRRYPDPESYYSQLPLDVAVDMIIELTEAQRATA